MTWARPSSPPRRASDEDERNGAAYQYRVGEKDATQFEDVTKFSDDEDALEAYEARQSLLNNEVSGAPATAKKKVLPRPAEESIGLTC